MLVKDTFASSKTVCSFEFFPPKEPAAQNELMDTIARLMPLKPAHVSVTYGAGGTTRARTHTVVERIRKETDLTVAAHLTCVGSGRDEMRTVIQNFVDAGVENILALRGDPPKGEANWNPPPDCYPYAADLVAAIKRDFPGLGIGVAGFPEGHFETPNRLKEMEYLKAKVDAGADYIVTQLFFDNRDFYDFCERCELAGIDVPIVAGILPISSAKMMSRVADLAAGARFPAPLQKWFNRAGDDERVAELGVHWAAEQVRDLVDHEVAGIHFYTLNRPEATLGIFRNLGLQDSAAL